MRFYQLCFCVLLFSSISSSAQNPGAGISPQGPPAVPIFIEDLAGRPFVSKGLEDIAGHPYLVSDWSWGAVKFANGKFAKDITLHFSTYNNKLYFKKGNEQQEFVLPVREFMLGYMNGVDSVARIFRNGYPAIGNIGSETFFELLSDGRFQVLKLHHKIISTYKPYNQPERKEFKESQELYVFAPGNKMIKIKKDKNFLLTAFPEFARDIESHIQSNNLKIKTEEGLLKLFSLMNQKT